EPAGLELCEPLARAGDPAGDQVRVEVERPRSLHELLEIVSNERLPARQVQLHHPERLRLAEDTQPVRGAERIAVARVVERIRAVHAAERTAVRQLGHQRVRPRRALRHPSPRMSPRSAMAPRKASTSRSTASRGCGAYFSARRSMIA